MIERVLAPVDLSVSADAVLASLRPLLAGHDSEVVLLHVLPYEADEAAARDAWRELSRRRDELATQGFRARALIRDGVAPLEILDFAAEARPSLIAMTTHGRTGLSRALRGSVAESVLRRAPCPLYLLNPSAPRANGQGDAPGPVLVPLDGTPASAAILPLAVEFAWRYGGEVVLLHVRFRAPGARPAPAEAVGIRAGQVAAALATQVEQLSRAGLRARSRIAAGDPARAILSAARETGASMIAMSTHGRAGLARAAWGSVAEQVLRRWPYTLLLRRGAEAQAAGRADFRGAESPEAHAA